MTAATAGALLLLAGCGSSSEPAEQESAGCNYDTTFEGVSVSGTGGSAPTIEVTDSTPATELGVEDLCEGDGATVAQGDTVTVDYLGVSLSTGETFDASYGSGQPVTFGLDQVIPGWSQGLVGMQEGGTRLLVIPGELAYGETSPTPAIGPNETLVFVVDLIAVQ
jgi:peptidylprolyl isomerase